MDPRTDRYTDAHVRGDPRLGHVAETYVRDYVGDFDAVTMCRDRILAGEQLTVSQIRTMLNIMRADPRVIDLPVPDDYDVVGVRRVGFGDRDTDAAYRRQLRRRPPFIDLPVRWHVTHGISLHKAAVVVHRFDARASFIRYFPQATQHVFTDRFTPHLRWYCAASVPQVPWRRRSRHPGIRLLTEHEAEVLVANELRRPCLTCDRTYRERGERGAT